MHSSRSQLETFAAGLVKTLVAIIALSAITPAFVPQSGRRIPKRESPAPVPTPSETESSTEAASKSERPRLQLLVAPNNRVASYSDYFSRYVLDGCLEGFKTSEINARPGQTMTRKEAIDYAKASKEIFVLWIDVEVDPRYYRSDPYDLRGSEYSVGYTVFTPETGKTKTSGRIFPRPYQPTVGGPGGSRIPVPTPRGSTPIEYSLRQAGQDVADRVISSIGSPLPDQR